MKICGIYKITSPSNKIYIGQSIDIVKRWNVYHRLHCANQTRLYYSFKKHGTEKHKFEILCQCDKSELNNLEEYYIRLYQTFNSKFGMNLQCRNDERIEISEETREKMSINRVGRKGYWKGKKLSEATRKK